VRKLAACWTKLNCRYNYSDTGGSYDPSARVLVIGARDTVRTCHPVLDKLGPGFLETLPDLHRRRKSLRAGRLGSSNDNRSSVLNAQGPRHSRIHHPKGCRSVNSKLCPHSLNEAANRMDERRKRSTHYPKHVVAGSAANLVLSV
jgi:hypothetical protein